MMKTIILEQEKIYCGTLLLVNANYPVRENRSINLVSVNIRFPNIFMKRDAANALQFVSEKIAVGDAIIPVSVSGYRLSEEQTAIYDGSIKDNGEAFTKKYAVLPDHSEHQTGLAIDLGKNKNVDIYILSLYPIYDYREEMQ